MAEKGKQDPVGAHVIMLLVAMAYLTLYAFIVAVVVTGSTVFLAGIYYGMNGR